MKHYQILILGLLVSCNVHDNNNIDKKSSNIMEDTNKFHSSQIDNNDFDNIPLVNIFKNDTIPKFADSESLKSLTPKKYMALRILWNIKEVRSSALALAKKNIPFFCDQDGTDSGFQYGFYELFPDHAARLWTYYIDESLKNIKEWDPITDKYVDYKIK